MGGNGLQKPIEYLSVKPKAVVRSGYSMAVAEFRLPKMRHYLSRFYLQEIS